MLQLSPDNDGPKTLKLPMPAMHGEPYLPPDALHGLSAVDRKTLVDSMRALRWEQRVFLHALLASATFTEAHGKLRDAGIDLNKSTTNRWMRSPPFVNAWRQLERAYVRNLTKDGVLAKTQALMEVAMTPKPILYKGRPTGHEEIDLGAAIRALELQGKATGAWSDEQQKTVVNIDIDFSGRPPEAEMRDVIDAEIIPDNPEALPAEDDWLA